MTEAASPGSKTGVLIIVENLPVPFDRRVWQEARTLRAAGYGVTIISPKGRNYEKNYEKIEEINIYRHGLLKEADTAWGYFLEYSSALVWQTLLAWYILIRHGFSVIHACNPPDLIFLVALPFRFLGKKFIFDHHDLCPELFEAKFGRRGRAYRALLLAERLTFRFAHVSIATNASYRRIAIERGGMDPDNVFIVRSGPDLNRMRLMPPDPKVKKGRRFLVGYVGVIGKQEGVDYLLRAAKRIVSEHGREDVSFVIVGGGTELPALQDLAAEMGLSAFVEFTGRVSDEDMLRILNTADVCVNPDVANVMNDLSTMNKVLEYMALAKPIVQFDLTEGRASAADASLYARPNDDEDLATKILVLLDDPAAREAMGRLGRQRIETELEWRFQVPKLLKAYATALGTAQPAPADSAMTDRQPKPNA